MEVKETLAEIAKFVARYMGCLDFFNLKFYY